MKLRKSRLRNDLHCVKWDIKLYYTIPYHTEKICREASNVAEYIELFGSFTRDRHARHI